VSTTQIYTHVLNRGRRPCAVRSTGCQRRSTGSVTTRGGVAPLDRPTEIGRADSQPNSAASALRLDSQLRGRRGEKGRNARSACPGTPRRTAGFVVLGRSA
jgi:hypothetical protein